MLKPVHCVSLEATRTKQLLKRVRYMSMSLYWIVYNLAFMCHLVKHRMGVELVRRYNIKNGQIYSYMEEA